VLHRTAYAGREEALRKLAGAQVDLSAMTNERDALAARVAELTAQVGGMVPADAAAADRQLAHERVAAVTADAEALTMQLATTRAQLSATEAEAAMARDSASALAAQVTALAAELEGQRRAAAEAAHRSDAADALAAAERERTQRGAEAVDQLRRQLSDREADGKRAEEVGGGGGSAGWVSDCSSGHLRDRGAGVAPSPVGPVAPAGGRAGGTRRGGGGCRQCAVRREGSHRRR
jgi:hypothetical protein